MNIETIESQSSDEELRRKILPRLGGHVFHVTDGTGYTRICRSGAIQPNDTGRYRFSSPSSINSFGRARGYICLMDLRNATDDLIDDALGRFYFLDPFTKSKVNVFLLLQAEAYGQLIPNAVGRRHSPAEMVVPHLEVWYPGRLPLSQIDAVIRIRITRPGKWDHLDLTVLKTMLRERNSRVAEDREA